MEHLTTEEKMILKAALSKKISAFISEQTNKDNHNLGFVPPNIVGLMTESAFAVLEATNSLNAYLSEQSILA